MDVEIMKCDACQFCENCHGCYMSEERANFLGYACKLDNKLNNVVNIKSNKCPNFKIIKRDTTKEKEIMVL